MITFFLVLAIIIGVLEGLEKIQQARNSTPLKVTNNLFKYLTDARF